MPVCRCLRQQNYITLTNAKHSDYFFLQFVPIGIPANFFWDISVRFLSWECWDFWRRHDHSRRSPKASEDVRSLPKTSEVCQSLPKASSLPVLFTSKIRGREEGIAIYSFYTWFSFLTWVWVNVFLEIVSSRTATHEYTSEHPVLVIAGKKVKVISKRLVSLLVCLI